MSETFTSSSESPSPQEARLIDVTKDDVLSADAEQLIAAANMDIARIQTAMSQVEHGGVEWNNLREQLSIAGSVAQHSRQYKNSSRLNAAESFTQFLNDKMSDADDVYDLDEYEAYQRTEDWLLKQAALSGGGMIGNVIRTELIELEQSERQDIEIPETEETVGEASSNKDKASAEAEARGSIERVFENELFDDIVKLGKNRTQLSADVKFGFASIGDGPSSNKGLLNFEGFMQKFKRDNKAETWREELNEFVMFTDQVEHDYREVTVPHETKGRFGRTIRTEHTKNEVVPDSERPKMIRNDLTGRDEPLVVFNYNFSLSTHHARNAEELPKYLEFGGYRGGQAVVAGLELPKSVAESLRESIIKNPGSVRLLVEKLFLENSNGEMSEEHWRVGREGVKHPVRPPYEQLPTDWNIALIANTAGGNSREYDVERLTTK